MERDHTGFPRTNAKTESGYLGSAQGYFDYWIMDTRMVSVKTDAMLYTYLSARLSAIDLQLKRLNRKTGTHDDRAFIGNSHRVPIDQYCQPMRERTVICWSGQSLHSEHRRGLGALLGSQVRRVIY